MILCYTGIDLVRLANDVGAGLGVSDTRVFLFSTFPQSKSVQKISFLPVFLRSALHWSCNSSSRPPRPSPARLRLVGLGLGLGGLE